MRRSILLLPVLTAALALSACASDDSGGGSTSSAVTATGSFGDKPDLTIPKADPPAKLSTKVLSEGDGSVVKKGDLLVADYLGQTWAEKDGKENVFDNSYDRKQPAPFRVGVGKVVKGWDQGLVGQKVGSRVLLTIPPADGYGDQAKDAIPAKSTLVFVVDLVDAIDVTKGPSGTPVTDLPAGLAKVTGGGDGKPPTVTIPKGVPAPTKATSAVLVRGDGKPISTKGTVVVQAVQVAWKTGKVVGSSWGQDPLPLTEQQLKTVPGLLQALDGAKVGTRIESTLPSKLANGPAGVLVLDVQGSY